jgi:hypothetical protein
MEVDPKAYRLNLLLPPDLLLYIIARCFAQVGSRWKVILTNPIHSEQVDDMAFEEQEVERYVRTRAQGYRFYFIFPTQVHISFM